MRAAIERCPSRRFSTYWTSVGDPAREAIELFRPRGAQLIRIDGADSFFGALKEKVEAIEASLTPHPMTTAAAVASLKKFIADDRYNIRLHDLLSDEADSARKGIGNINQGLGRSVSSAEVLETYRKYRESCTTLTELFIHGCTWSRADTDALFAATLRRVFSSGTLLNEGFCHYPLLLLLYAGGLAAVGAGKFGLLATLFTRQKLRDHSKVSSLVAALDWSRLNEYCQAEFPNPQNWCAPVSEHLFRALRERFRQYFTDDGDFEEIFDRYEYLQALVISDMRNSGGEKFWWAPMGRFARKYGRRQSDPIATQIDTEIASMGSEWPPLRAGLFGGSIERLNLVRTGVNDLIGRVGW